jgi:hypothetical protein
MPFLAISDLTNKFVGILPHWKESPAGIFHVAMAGQGYAFDKHPYQETGQSEARSASLGHYEYTQESASRFRQYSDPNTCSNPGFLSQIRPLLK